MSAPDPGSPVKSPPGTLAAAPAVAFSLADFANYAFLVGIVAIVGATSYLAFELPRAGTMGFWLYAGLPSVGLAIAGLARAHRDGELHAWIRPIWGDPTRGLLSAAVLVLGAVLFVHVVAPVGSPRESWMARIYLQLGSPDALRQNTTTVAAGIILIATAEEIVWRGLVTTLLAEKIGSRAAWVASAFLYAAALVPTTWALSDPVAGPNPMLPMAALALGLAWGAMTRFTGRLVPAILSHAAFDWCVIMMFRLWGQSV